MSIRSTPMRRRRMIAAIATIVVVPAIGFGAAAASGYFATPDTVKAALEDSNANPGQPGAHSALFLQGRTVNCTSSDNIVFDCTVASTAAVPAAGSVPYLQDYLGTTFPYSDDNGIVVGGCKGANSEGTRYTCFSGQRAVEEGTIGQGLLGAHLDGPTAG